MGQKAMIIETTLLERFTELSDLKFDMLVTEAQCVDCQDTLPPGHIAWYRRSDTPAGACVVCQSCAANQLLPAYDEAMALRNTP
jgi:hypothetical protein